MDNTPRRLRSACNQCHASKVKCSGEKTGCQRCESLGYKCHFEISMVGRHSHKRRRRKTTPTDSTSPSVRDEVVVNPTRTNEASLRDEDPAEEDPQLLTEFTDMLNTSNDLNMLSLFNWDAQTVVPHSSGMSAAESTMAAVSTSRPRADSVFVDSLAHMDVATTDGSYSISPRASLATTSSMEPGRGEFPVTPFSTTAVATVTSGSIAAPQHPAKDHETSDSRMYTLNLLNAITSLEAEMDNTSCSVDRCMDIIKSGTKEIQRAVQSRQWQRSVTGPVLVQVATEIALITMEKLAAQWRDGDGDGDGGGGGSGVGGGGHDDDHGRATGSLHLGQYSTESDEASFIWRQVVLFEARRLQQLVKVVGAKLDRSGRCHSGPRPEGRLKLFCADQDERLSNLISTLLKNDMMAG
ncbi:hypothetical protein LMH87_010142 [Akanthomyces muscarius]|uniref:Zn(2)-C6 fungal-type domain-containing protein n=1 Tax=Akanthomyces muscarius TaxID=2231603 RepID=A0A9W8QDD7_AKAMU|nr:hypothetical protein LMH87_010142 [Akanthomyces muscarius]KAJ4153662.1 hypothetical protein LMH87_010142 [Akanthomyces muscarius]